MRDDGLAVDETGDREATLAMTSPAELAPGALISFEAAQNIERQMLGCSKAAASGDFPNDKAFNQSGFSEPSLFHEHGIVLWQTPQALIVPSGMPRIAGFDAAARASAVTGWPVFERDTGGDLTPQFEGILNLSMAFAVGEGERNIASAYGRLIAPVVAFLREDMGIDAYASSVRGAFCDGAHNIVIDGRKLAGTAQRWRLMPERAGEANITRVLGHIAIVCGGNLDGALDAVNAFYRNCGIDRHVVRNAHITLQQAAAGQAHSPDEIARSLSDFIVSRG